MCVGTKVGGDYLIDCSTPTTRPQLPLAFICVVNVRLKEEKEHLNVGLFRLE